MAQFKKYSALYIALLFTAFSACSDQTNNKVDMVECPNHRPLICTAEYFPVIGIDKQGKEAEYSNACTACSHKNVLGYTLKKQKIEPANTNK